MKKLKGSQIHKTLAERGESIMEGFSARWVRCVIQGADGIPAVHNVAVFLCVYLHEAERR